MKLKHIVPAGLALGACTLLPAFATTQEQSLEASERREARIVLRLHQLVYGMPELCAGQADAEAVRAAATKFQHAYPELVPLLEDSPHAATARARTQEMLDDTVGQARTQPLAECGASATMLEDFVSGTEGQAQIREALDELRR